MLGKRCLVTAGLAGGSTIHGDIATGSYRPAKSGLTPSLVANLTVFATTAELSIVSNGWYNGIIDRRIYLYNHYINVCLLIICDTTKLINLDIINFVFVIAFLESHRMQLFLM